MVAASREVLVWVALREALFRYLMDVQGLTAEDLAVAWHQQSSRLDLHIIQEFEVFAGCAGL